MCRFTNISIFSIFVVKPCRKELLEKLLYFYYPSKTSVENYNKIAMSLTSLITAVLFISILGENCEVCRPPFIFQNGKCVSSCPSTKCFPDIRHKRCELCHPGCSRCYGPNKWDCMECRGNYTLVEGTCVLHCDAARYTDDIMGKCQPCNEICKTCSGPTQYNCTSCGNGTYHDTESNTCVEKCTEGYYGQVSTCYSCHHTCKACLQEKIVVYHALNPVSVSIHLALNVVPQTRIWQK